MPASFSRTADPLRRCTAFDGGRLLASGQLLEVALAVKRAIDGGAIGPVLTFDDETGEVIELDIRGTNSEMLAALMKTAPQRTILPTRSPAVSPAEPDQPPVVRGRGRPRLGVVAREVTLLPRHWEWLAAQAGGASVTLRALVDNARRAGGPPRVPIEQERAYRFIAVVAGDLPGFEEASRALFANDRQGFVERATAWPADIRAHAVGLAFPTDPSGSS